MASVQFVAKPIVWFGGVVIRVVPIILYDPFYLACLLATVITVIRVKYNAWKD